jgi:hypothetical protein
MRAILVVLLVLGLAIGYCGGLEQAILGRATFLVSQAGEKAGGNPVAPQLEEARQAMDVSFSMTTTSMYAGVAVALAACMGLYLHEKNTLRGKQP